MLEGKVALVTGSGRGIGRSLAMVMASHGAKIVVNDLGSESDGQGKNVSVAQQVVDEIKAAGGQATANTDSVSDFAGAGRMIQQAVDEFGRIDIVVNNAGIVRDKMIFNMSEQDFDAVVAVHLKGNFNTIRHASTQFRQQKSGRIINITSTSGLIGNYGQANYAAAKMGIVGLTKICALDLKKYNVTANCISPFAWSRLIGTIPDEESQKERLANLKKLDPNHIAPLAVFLASDQAQDVSGQIFGVRGAEVLLFSQTLPVRSAHREGGWDAAELGQVVNTAFRGFFTPVQVSADVFGYDPMI